MRKNIQIFLAVFFIFAVSFSLYLWGEKSHSPVVPPQNIAEIPVEEVGENVNPGGNITIDTGTGLSPVPQDSLTIVRWGDIQKCNTLSGALQGECRDAIFYNSAIDYLQYGKCDSIEDSTLKKNCNDKISRALYSKAGVLADCSNIRDEELKKMCITRFSALTDANGLAICATITDTQEATRCSDSYYITQVRSGKIKDSTICSKITDALTRRECQIIMNKNIVASNAKDSSLGETIKTECSGNGFCMKEKIVTISGTSGDTAGCLSITEEVMQKNCINEIQSRKQKSIFDKAFASKDPSICEQISDAAAVKRCKEIVSK